MLHGLGLANPSGWMKLDIFPQVLKHFIDNMTVSKDQPGVMDNHNSHITLEGVELAKNHGLDLLTLPPHCSHKLQPLDVVVFGAFKKFYIGHILGKHCLYIMLQNHLGKHYFFIQADWNIFLQFRKFYRGLIFTFHSN